MAKKEKRNKGLLLGSHMSVAGGVENAPVHGAKVGCTALQIFVKNNNRWAGPPISEKSAAAFPEALAQAGIGIEAVFAHTSYLINLASPKEEVAAKSVVALIDELERCELLGVPGLVMHPGSHLGEGRDYGIEKIARLAREVFDRTPEVRTRLLLETTAGQGTNLGAAFEDLRDIMDAIDRPDRMGVCVDTCHIFAAGYEIRDAKSYKDTMGQFDRIVGLENLRAIHLNDSKMPFGSRKDRHEHIGQGEIGLEAFRNVLNDRRLRGIPMALETDKGDDLAEDRMNLETLLGLVR